MLRDDCIQEQPNCSFPKLSLDNPSESPQEFCGVVRYARVSEGIAMLRYMHISSIKRSVEEQTLQLQEGHFVVRLAMDRMGDVVVSRVHGIGFRV